MINYIIRKVIRQQGAKHVVRREVPMFGMTALAALLLVLKSQQAFAAPILDKVFMGSALGDESAEGMSLAVSDHYSPFDTVMPPNVKEYQIELPSQPKNNTKQNLNHEQYNPEAEGKNEEEAPTETTGVEVQNSESSHENYSTGGGGTAAKSSPRVTKEFDATPSNAGAWAIAGAVGALAIGGGVALAMMGGNDEPKPTAPVSPRPSKSPSPPPPGEALIEITQTFKTLGTADSEVFNAGDRVRLTITVTNTSEEVAQALILGTAFNQQVISSIAAVSNGTVDSGRVEWTLPSLSPGDSHAFVVEFYLNDLGQLGENKIYSNVTLHAGNVTPVHHTASAPLVFEQTTLDTLSAGKGNLLSHDPNHAYYVANVAPLVKDGQMGYLYIDQDNSSAIWSAHDFDFLHIDMNAKDFIYAFDTPLTGVLNIIPVTNQAGFADSFIVWNDTGDFVTFNTDNAAPVQTSTAELSALQKIASVQQIADMNGNGLHDFLVIVETVVATGQAKSTTGFILFNQGHGIDAESINVNWQDIDPEKGYIIGNANSDGVYSLSLPEITVTSAPFVSDKVGASSGLIITNENVLALGDITGNGVEDFLVYGFEVDSEFWWSRNILPDRVWVPSGDIEVERYQVEVKTHFEAKVSFKGFIVSSDQLSQGFYDLHDAQFSNMTTVLQATELFSLEHVESQTNIVLTPTSWLNPLINSWIHQHYLPGFYNTLKQSADQEITNFVNNTQDTLFNLGDINRSGVNDIAFTFLGQNEIYILYGDSLQDTSSLNDLGNGEKGFVITHSGLAADAMLGMTVRNLGDINGDGYDDFAIAAPFASTGNFTENGVVYIIYGSPDYDATIDLAALAADVGFRIEGSDDFAQIGKLISNVGDINGDGFNDFSVSFDEAGETSHAVVFGFDVANGFDIVGTNGDDIIYANDSGESIFAGGGNNILIGGAGDDRLVGGSGHDVLFGGAGNNQLWGGAGNDRFVVAPLDSPQKQSIMDFSWVSPSQGDVIDLSAFWTMLKKYDLDMSGTLDHQQFINFATGRDNLANVNNVRIIDGDMHLNLNSGQIGEQDAEVVVTGLSDLNHAHFIFNDPFL